MKIYLFAAAACLTLVGANAPTPPPGDPDDYPPCSRTVRDHCTQGYDRESTAVLSADDPAYRDGPPPPPGYGPPPPGYGPPSPPEPIAVRNDYPPCSATIRDRCIQGQGYRMARAQPRTVRTVRTVWRHVRRAGERG
jgi:hypothetical protein